jgi:hypothetical protein
MEEMTRRLRRNAALALVIFARTRFFSVAGFAVAAVAAIKGQAFLDCPILPDDENTRVLEVGVEPTCSVKSAGF